MSIDITQFHQVFFEESFEGLDAMESGLLELDIGEADLEAINTIFRAAHSIKGGAGTFGFSAVSDFTHVAEALLDEVRDGKREVSRELVDLLLQAVDCLREMLTATRDEEATDDQRIAEVKALMDAELNGGIDLPYPVTAGPDSEALAVHGQLYKINFEPHPHLFRTGNDPVRILRELNSIAQTKAEVDLSNLPPFSEMNVDECYLRWNLTTQEVAEREAVRAVFDWVEGDCEFAIEDLPANAEDLAHKLHSEDSERAEASAGERPEKEVPPVAVPEQAVAPVDTPAPERRKGEDRRRTDRRNAGGDSSIRVSIDKVDGLINLVGELVITQSMLGQIGEDISSESTQGEMLNRLRDGLTQLERNTREMQESVMRIRMLPISFVFQRFPRLVRDLSGKLGRQVELQLHGEQTELDKTVMEKIGDPLVHLVRNALDHGIEAPEKRREAGKPETGTVSLNAFHEGGNIIIEISDDGAGLDCEKLLAKAIERGVVSEEDSLSDDKIRELIFHPGFSTAQEVSDVSGRGVGMDVVRRNIKDLGGSVDIKSTLGKGTKFTIRLPLTLAILDGQLVRVGEQIYIVPLVSIVESLQVQKEHYNSVAGKGELYRLREEYLPIVRLYETFNVKPEFEDIDKGLLVVVEGDGIKAGILVDDLLAQQQVVIKSLESNYRKVEGVSGATILGDGTVAMILDVSGLVCLSHRPQSDATQAA